MVIKEKKVEVEINGKIFRCAEHMLADIAKFGASQTKRVIKNPPKEVVMMMAPKKIILPVADISGPAEVDEPLVELGVEYPGDIPEVPTPKTRKPRTASRSTK